MPPQLGSIYPMESQRTLLPVPAVSQYCPNPNPVSQSTNYFHFPETFPSQRFFPFSPLSPFPIDSIPPLPHIPFPPPLPFPLGYDALMPGLCCFMERQRTAFLPHSFPPFPDPVLFCIKLRAGGQQCHNASGGGMCTRDS